jgi:hypothetical protein
MEESEDLLEIFFSAKGEAGACELLLARIQQLSVLAPELQRIVLSVFELDVDHVNGTVLLREINRPRREICVPLSDFVARVAAFAGRTIEEQDDHEPGADDPAVAALTAVDIEGIDRTILSFCDYRWRKVAYVVASAMDALRYAGIPDVYYSQRVRALVANGLIEAHGNVRRMRFCEVRLAPEGTAAPAWVFASGR